MRFRCVENGCAPACMHAGDFIVASEEDMKTEVFISTERRRNIVPSYICYLDCLALFTVSADENDFSRSAV